MAQRRDGLCLVALAWLAGALALDFKETWHGGEALLYLPAVWLAVWSGNPVWALYVSAAAIGALLVGSSPWRHPFPGVVEWGLRVLGVLACGITALFGLLRIRLQGTLEIERKVSLKRAQEIAQLHVDNEQLRREAQSSSTELSASLLENTARREEAEQALRDSEALYHSLVDHLPLSVLRKDSQFRYSFVNRRFVEFSGKRVDEIIGKTDFDLFPEALARQYREGDELVISTGQMFDDVEDFRKPNGEELAIQVLKMPVRDSQKRIIGTQVMVLDVTGRRRAEKSAEQASRQLEQQNRALVESEEKLRQQTEVLESILESIADAVIVADKDGRFMVWNPAAERIVGQGPTEKPTEAWTNVYGLFLPDRKTPFPPGELPLARAMRGEEVSDIEMWISSEQKPEGALISINGTPLRDSDGQLRGGVIVFRDVTRQRAAEAEIQSKNQDLETLLYVTSHDLREPLRAIENFSRIVRDRYADKIDAKGQDFLERVVKGAERLDQLLEDVLTLSRVQRTAQPVDDIEAGEIVEDVLRRLESRIRETEAQVQVVAPLPRIRADRRWAMQAVQNLVSNALKYTREGVPPEVEIAGYSGPEGAGLAVRDRGMGVPPEYAERIFGLFQRAVSRKIEGTGAGLAIVKRVAERHGGRAWVRPRDGHGSEFIITFGPGTPV